MYVRKYSAGGGLIDAIYVNVVDFNDSAEKFYVDGTSAPQTYWPYYGYSVYNPTFAAEYSYLRKYSERDGSIETASVNGVDFNDSSQKFYFLRQSAALLISY